MQIRDIRASYDSPPLRWHGRGDEEELTVFSADLTEDKDTGLQLALLFYY